VSDQPPQRDPQPIKYLDTHLFVEGGYLQELNRQFLHPLGLALEVTKWTEKGIDKFTDNVMERWSTEEITDRNTRDLIKDVLSRLGIDAGARSITGVWDARDDPEGWVFEWESDEELSNAHAKAANIKQIVDDRFGDRIRVVGHWVQLIPGYTEDDLLGDEINDRLSAAHEDDDPRVDDDDHD